MTLIPRMLLPWITYQAFSGEGDGIASHLFPRIRDLGVFILRFGSKQCLLAAVAQAKRRGVSIHTRRGNAEVDLS